MAIVWFIDTPSYEPLIAVLGGIAAFLASHVAARSRAAPEHIELFSADCGDRPLDLERQRLILSKAFGTYFTGMLEREASYVLLPGQIDCPPVRGFAAAEPIQRIFWAIHHPRGPRILIIAAEGGMGKSTLATKIVRCMHEQEAVDMILGDSAKTEEVDPISGIVHAIPPGYYNVASFYSKLGDQLAVTSRPNGALPGVIRDRLEGRRALIVVDNLETVQSGEQLVQAIRTIVSRDVRAIITTRTVSGFDTSSDSTLVIRLNPLSDVATVQRFLSWHISQFQSVHPALSKLEDDLHQERLIRKLTAQTGGIPLLIQVLVSNVVRQSWDYLDSLPNLFGVTLLAFLYQNHWDELGTLGSSGGGARELLRWISAEQYVGNKISNARLGEWANASGYRNQLEDIVRQLHERFMLVNMDINRGSYAISPSLSAFIREQPL